MANKLTSFLHLSYFFTSFVFFLNISIFAQTTVGPNYAGTGANVTGIGTVAWTNPGNALSDDNSYATITLTTGSTASNYLQTTNYGFSIPTDAAILGIQLTIGRFQSAIAGGNDIRDVVVQLLKGGSLVGSNLAAGVDWPTSEAAANYGGAANLWGTTWIPSEINASGFGVALAVNTTNVPRTGSVDYISISITYVISKYFRSQASGNWNATSTWEESTDGSTWVAATRTPIYGDFSITISNTHTVTVTASVSTDETTVDAGGQVTVNSGQTLTIADGTGTDLTVNGTLVNSGTLTFNTGITATFGSGSIYQHAKDAGTIPTATWNANSTCSITGITTTIPTGLGQAFSNFTWNCANQTAATTPTTTYNIQGNLTVQNTGTGQFRMGTGTTSNNNVLGNYLQSGGTVRISGATARTLNVSGNFNLSGGTFLMSNAATLGTLNVVGNFSHSNGTITQTLTGGSGSIIFNGTSNQSYTGGGTISNTINFTINNPAGITLLTSVNFPAGLTMTSGNITTSANTLSLGTSTSNLGTLSRTSGTIIGNFRRWFTTGAVINVLFPIGTSTNYRPANISFTSAPTAGGTLTAFFTASNPGTAGLPLDDAGTSIINAGKEGYWTINAADGLTGGVYSLDLTADGFTGVSVVSTLRLLKRTTGGNWTLQGTHSAGTGTTTTPIVHRTGMSGFSEFGVGGASDNPLPVELSSFTAVVKTDGVNLKWRTETEVSNYGFEVQRALSKVQSQDWEILGFVEGHGNSNSPKEYSFVDENIPSGKYLYRLEQIDTEGTFTYSQIIEVEIDKPLNFVLSQNYPNPFNPVTTIRFSLPQSGNVKLTVFNILGEEVTQLVNGFKEAGVNTINFNAENFNSGLYLYKLETAGFTDVKKMVLVK